MHDQWCWVLCTYHVKFWCSVQSHLSPSPNTNDFTVVFVWKFFLLLVTSGSRFYKIALLSNLLTRFYYATCILHKRIFFKIISMSSQQLFCMFLYCLSIVGTSDGTQTHLNDLSGGHCNDTKNGIFMKIEVYVCKKSNLTHTGNVQLLQYN